MRFIQMFVDLVENLLKPLEKDDPQERIDRWSAEIAESSSEDFLDADGGLNRSKFDIHK